MRFAHTSAVKFACWIKRDQLIQAIATLMIVMMTTTFGEQGLQRRFRDDNDHVSADNVGSTRNEIVSAAARYERPVHTFDIKSACCTKRDPIPKAIVAFAARSRAIATVPTTSTMSGAAVTLISN